MAARLGAKTLPRHGLQFKRSTVRLSQVVMDDLQLRPAA
jgi:hypothetical protein